MWRQDVDLPLAGTRLEPQGHHGSPGTTTSWSVLAPMLLVLVTVRVSVSMPAAPLTEGGWLPRFPRGT